MQDLQQQLAFIVEMDRLKAVYRQTTVKDDKGRFENSAEHSWHIAVMAHVFAPMIAEPVDIHRACLMLLLHDIVEIDAGDTFAFASAADIASKADKESEAADRLFGLLPDSQASDFRTLWQEYEDAESADARFAKAMDCLLPLIQNMNNEGGSWRRHQVSRSKVVARNKYLEHSAPKLWEYALEQIDIALDKGWLQEG
ncbi:HD domain-containing protein [Pseudoteredinibacter isoporae]|uniref:Putative hydrolase of HD superfamily n=1 Tax=Pseudoteredinibacter isoporae TaxID=570281 RepID=A0A7X0JTU2_9GAMM|nr:HD domain-containing protein [Pseudoteredinibacter isoporae]MBB6522133.1 putative hydrolase of HD superfamily [Pseudoteredinibacter isoporae]NHO87668.1 HD domain-containing protein [Pseudoteredinibacter isoporae]NIB24001.1 HD domain-containing protein [Pseudoteredinibacter isoporae]